MLRTLCWSCRALCLLRGGTASPVIACCLLGSLSLRRAGLRPLRACSHACKAALALQGTGTARKVRGPSAESPISISISINGISFFPLALTVTSCARSSAKC